MSDDVNNMGPVDWLETTVRVTRDGVYFGDHKLPGCIAEHGVTLKPGGYSETNQLTVQFIVGRVVMDDPLDDDKQTPKTNSVNYNIRANETEDAFITAQRIERARVASKVSRY